MLSKPSQGWTRGLVSPDFDWFWDIALFAVLPGGTNTRDYVSGSLGVLLSSGNWDGIIEPGQSLNSTSTTDGGAAWVSQNMDQLVGTREFTAIYYGDVTAEVNWSHLIMSPYDVGGWNAPFVQVGLGRSGADDYGMLYSSTGGFHSSVVANWVLTSDGVTFYSASRKNDLASLYKDGVFFGSNTWDPGNEDIRSVVNGPPIVAIQNRQIASPGEGLTGNCIMGAILSKSITDAQHAQLGRDPFGPFRLYDEAAVVYALAVVTFGSTNLALNHSGASDIGGAIGAELTDDTLNNIWDNVSAGDADAGDTEFRCTYVKNTHATLSVANVKVEIATDPTESNWEIALGAAGKNGTETAVANEDTAPATPTFGTTALELGTLAAGDFYPIWIKRIVIAGAGAATPDSGLLRILGDDPN